MVPYSVKTPFWLRMIYPQGLLWRMLQMREPTVYITFDDGPHPTGSGFICNELAKYNAKATFFCLGKNVLLYPDAYKQITDEGHGVANHTHNHLNGWKTDNDTYMQNIALAAEHIDSKLFRPPYGMIRRSQVKRIKTEYPDWKICMWDVLSGDFDRGITPEKCLKNVLDTISPGAIVLFHDSDKAWPRMSYALPLVLAHCKKKGWAMKVLP